MRCPLCGGPVHVEDGAFECEVGHRVDAAHMERWTDRRLSEALMMAIEALDSEAFVLQTLGGEGALDFANDAGEQATLLRQFARRHAPRINDEDAA